MGYYTLRNFVEPLLPTGDEEHLADLEAEARGGNSLVNSFKMARVGNEMSLLADEESQLRTSDDPAKQEAARLLRSRIRTLRDESAAFATAPQRYEDVHGLGDAGSYVAGQVGQAVGSSIDQMATGSAMGIASGVAGLIPHPAAQAVAWGLRGAAPLEMYRQNKNLLTGEAYNEIADDPVAMQRSAQDIRDEVSRHGYRAALLDTIPQLLPVGQISGVAGKALGRIPTSAKLLGAAVGEAATETGQQYSQQRAHSTLNPDRPTVDDQSELINSALGGFIGGGAMGGMGHVGEKMWARGRTEGDGQNGDVIDLNAPGTTSTKPEVTLNPVEQLRGKPGKFNDRESQLALVAALEGRSVEDGTTEGDMQSLETRRNLLVEHLKKIRGSQAADLLTLIESTPFESQDDKYATFDDENFKAAESLVKRKNKLTDSDLTKRNAEEPYLEGFGEIPREAVDRLPDPSEPKPSLTAGKVDSADFTFDSTPDMFADLQPEAGEPHGSINDRSAANKARYEEAQQKAKLFGTRSELVANRLWRAYTDEHGYNIEEAERDAGPAGDIQRITYERVRRDDPGAVDNIRDLTSEIMAISTVDAPTPAEERRADRLAQRLVEVIGDRAGDQLADIRRITGGSDLLRKVTDRVDHYARTDRAGLQAQFDDRDAAAQELVKMIPAEVEARLLKEHGIDLSSNKDRNDILDLMEDVADGKTSVPRIKLTKLFTRRVVDAMEGYLGNTIMPRMAGVREEHIDENDSSGGMTQATNADDVHDTEITTGDFRDIAEDGAGEVDDFEAGAAEKSHSKVAPESMVYNWAGTKKATVKDFTKAWDRNDEGRLPKLLHPGDGRMLERVQTLAGLAAEHLGDQRDRYVIGNPLAKDPIEAAGGTSAKKLMDRAGMSDDKRTQLMLEYMQQEDKSEKFDPTEANDVVKKIHFLTKIDDELTDILVNRTAIGPYGGQLSTQEKIENRGKPLDIPLDRLMPLVPPSDAAVLQKLFDSRKDVNTRVSNETLMTTVAPIVHRAKQLALDHMKTVVPGVSEFIAENPGAELKDFVNNYFSQRYAVVAEQPTDRDYLQLSPTEFKDMATRGAKALKSVYNDVGTDEAAQTVARAGRNVIHFESPHSKSGVVSIPAHALVEWVRDGRNAHTKDKNVGEASRGPQRSQHESYRDDLGEGISALVQNGLVTGLPWIVNAAGEREDFAPGETKTVPSYKVTSGPLTERQDYKTSKAQNYFVTQKGHAVKDGWKRAGVGELPPSLDLDGISVKEYNEQRGKKAYAQKMQAQADAKAKAELRAGMTPEQREQFDRNEYAEKRVAERREEARKNKELSQDPVDVQGEEAVDEAMRISEGSQTRKDEREHLQMMTSVMRAAADYLPGALTVKGAVNKAASVAGNVWKTYMADPEAGLARMAGYIRSIARGKHSGDFEGQKAFREIWNDYHALEDPAPAAQRGWGHVENKEFAKRLAADNPNVDVNHLELLEENVQDKTWNPNLIGDVDRDPKVNPRKDMALKAVQTAAQHPALVNAEANAVGGPHYALPLAAILTPRNLEAARPQDKPLMLDMRARVAATIQALWTDGKIDGGQVRKLVNHLSGYTDATLREKQDRKVPPNALAQLERRNAAKVTEGFIPNAKVREFLNGLVKGGNAAVEIQYPGTGFEGGRYHTVADRVGGDKTKPLAVSGPVRGQGSTLAEREAAAAAAPAVRVAGGRATVKNLSLDYKGGTVDHDAEITALEAEYIARGIPKARKVEPKEPSKVAAPLLKNPPSAPAKYQPKETAKLLGADRVIAPVSTEGYAGDLGRAAQAEGVRFNPKHDTDMAGKVVLVSVPGKGRGFTAVDKLIEHVKMALDRGATVRTDSGKNATSAHNAEGEGVLRQALIDGGYTEAYTTEHFSAWQKVESPEKHTPSSQIQAPGATKPASEGVGSQNTLGAAIAKHQEYLKNPPEDYTTERAAAIGTWAAKQHARVVAELAKTDDGTDQYDRLDELRFKLDQLGKASAAKVAESTEAEEHERKYGPQGSQGPRVKGTGRSEKLRNERQKLRSTALAELKADWPEAYRYALAHPERTIDDEFELSGEFSKALTELDTELDSAVAQLQARSDTPHVTQLRERLNTLHESFISGEGGYDVLYKQYIGIDAEIAALEEKLGPQGSVKRNAEALTEEQAAAQFDQLSKMSAPPPKHIQVTSAEKHFERTLGDKVKLILQDSFPDMKVGSADYNLATNVARIATANPLRILRLAYHESVHGMFNTILNAKGMEATKEMLYRAASEPKMYARLKEMLKEHTNALKDMENDMEERVAYMFQFSKLGMLTIDKKPETFFEKVQAMMRRVFGAVRDSEKALAILTAFDEGGLKEPSAAGQVIAEIMSRGEWHKKLLARFDAQSQALYTEVMAAHNVFRNSESATAQMLGKLFYTNPGYGADTERVNGVQEGMINSTQFKRNYYSNRINDALRPLDGPNMERDLKTLAEALNSHTEPTSELVRNAKNAIGKILNEFRSYAKSSGLDLGKQIGADKRYWPRVYEIEKLINGKDDFVNMLLTKHGKLMRTIASTMRDSGKYPGATEQDAAEAIHQSLVDRLGVEDSRLDAERDDGVLSPYFASQNERRLDWLSDEDVAPFLSTDVTGTLTQYISQGVRAVEYTKMFGERGQTLKEMLARKGDLNFVTADGKPVFFHKDGPILRELKQAAEDQKVPEKDRTDWVERRFEDLKRASGAMEGSLGKDISAGYRKFQAGMMTFQLLRCLPLMIFSSMLDPNGIRVAGGDFEDMFAAYKRGFVGLWHNWKDMFLGNPYGSREADDLELAALAAGVINSDAINEERGNVHSSEFSSGTTRRINHAFFKAIGITQWDRDMRIMATAAARKAIVNHFNNTVPEHSARWLRELGLKRGDVYLNDKGELIVSAAELMKVKKIKNVATAQKMLEPTHFAINRWVNRAIVSPNAGLRPTRASDPHFAMFYQFKSFTYAFQETTMRYALHEAQNGNKTAALQLLRGVPIMIAADMTKAMVTGGGSLPGYMANWTLLDWVMHGINRAGLTGTGSFATDILSGNISGTLAGPSVGQAFSVAGDLLSGDVGGAITQSLPGVKQMNFMHG